MLEATENLIGKDHVESSRNVAQASLRAVNKQCPDREIVIAYIILPVQLSPIHFQGTQLQHWRANLGNTRMKSFVDIKPLTFRERS